MVRDNRVIVVDKCRHPDNFTVRVEDDSKVSDKNILIVPR